MFGISKQCSLGVICLLLILPGRSFAGQNHAGYVRAMDDLRSARALLQRSDRIQPVDESPDEVSLTIDNIDRAMKQIDQAIGAASRKSQELPKIDERMTWVERLTQSLRFLDKAELDCAGEKDASANAGLKARVFDLLDQAHTRLSVAIQTVNFDYSSRHLPTRNY
jgi:hypothetical protein